MTLTHRTALLCSAALIALPAATLAHEDHDHGDEARQLEAHVHGTGTLDIAIEDGRIVMALEAPGADIVGFESEPASHAQKAAVEAAFETLNDPLALFQPTEAANCTVAATEVELHYDGAEHGDEAAHGHDHDEADAEAHEHDHGEAHAEAEGHDDHGGSHSAFEAAYTLDCGNPDRLDRIDFAYFDRFENAMKLEVQVVTPVGATGADITRDATRLDLGGLM